MRVRKIIDEWLQDYCLPSMYIAMGTCDYKCCLEAGIPPSVCHNSALHQLPEIEVSADEILRRFLSNNLTQAVVLGGLDPMNDPVSITELLKSFRKNGCNVPFVIFTGYTEEELRDVIFELSVFENIIIKFGRYIPNHEPHFDGILGVELASDNQYGKKIS